MSQLIDRVQLAAPIGDRIFFNLALVRRGAPYDAFDVSDGSVSQLIDRVQLAAPIGDRIFFNLALVRRGAPYYAFDVLDGSALRA